MYIDPGATNFIIQIVIGVVAGAGLAIATFWRRIVNLFSKNKGKDAKTATPEPAAEVAAAPAAPAAEVAPVDRPASTPASPAAEPPAPASEPQIQTSPQTTTSHEPE